MRWLPLILLAGCVYGPSGLVRPPTQPEALAVHDAMSAWDLPETVATCDSTELVVAVARTHREMYLMTGLCGPTDGPLDQWQEDHCWYRTTTGRIPRRVAGAYLRTYRGGMWPFALVRHEAVHWLQECTGRGQTYPSHADSEVWCPEGCVGRFRGSE